MTVRKVQAKSKEEMLADFPVDGKRPNWYFRMTETSSNAWLVEGCDVWGRKVSRSGGDPEALLEECLSDAAVVDAQTKTNDG